MSLAVRERDGWRCVLCGERDPKVLEAGHLFSRVFTATRFFTGNVFCQCRSCNRYHEINAHIFTLWFIRQFGLPSYEALAAAHRAIHKNTAEDYAEIIAAWKAVPPAHYKRDPEIERLLDKRTRDERELRRIEQRVDALRARADALQRTTEGGEEKKDGR